MPNVRAFPPNSYPIANIKSRDKEKAAAAFDVEGKGYLTFDQLAAWYQAEHAGNLPSLQDLARFLGKPQHELKAEHLNGWEILQSNWMAGTFKGDFRIASFDLRQGYAPAGNVRVGREIGPQWDNQGQQHDVDQLVVLVDFNFIDKNDFDARIKNATLVVGPKGFAKEPGGMAGEAVEVQLTALSEPETWTVPVTRYGPAGAPIRNPEKKLLAAQLDVADLRKLMGDAGGISFYARVETVDGKTHFINPEGHAYRNFEVTPEELAPQGNA